MFDTTSQAIQFDQLKPALPFPPDHPTIIILRVNVLVDNSGTLIKAFRVVAFERAFVGCLVITSRIPFLPAVLQTANVFVVEVERTPILDILCALLSMWNPSNADTRRWRVSALEASKLKGTPSRKEEATYDNDL